MSRNNNDNEHRPHYLPHQHILDKQRMIERSVKCSDINGILTIISGNKINKRNSNLMSDKMVIDAEHKKISEKVGISKSNNNTNLLLFGQYSKTTSSMTQKAKEKKCIGCTPGGLATTALTMNLSTISPLCTNVGCIGASCSKDANTSSRVSRSASPALGNTSDNPRFRIGYLKKLIFILNFFLFFLNSFGKIFNCFDNLVFFIVRVIFIECYLMIIQTQIYHPLLLIMSKQSFGACVFYMHTFHPFKRII